MAEQPVDNIRNGLSKGRRLEPSPREVAAVIVTYNPDGQFSERAGLTLRQVDKVIVVDNASGEDARSMLGAFATASTVELIENEENLGIAAALNRGVRRAMEQGYSWVLLLDQDSRPASDMVSSLIAGYKGFTEKEKVALVASVIVDERTGRAFAQGDCRSRKSVRITSAITSGSFLRASAFSEAGPFREDFFIDHVDSEYSFRLKKAGFSIITSCRARLLHNIGSPTVHKFLWKTGVKTTNHSATRLYYGARNRLLVIKEYMLDEPRWSVQELRYFLKLTVKVALFEEDRGSKIWHTLMGVRDALLNRTGKLS